MKTIVRKTIVALIIPIILILAWFYATTRGNIPDGILPSISKVWQAFLEMVES